MNAIPKDSTIATVWPHLAEPRIYVATVRHRMEQCLKEHGNAHVRIGIRGRGLKPCYRITHTSAAGAEAVYGSWWDNHQPLEIRDAVTDNWSTSSMDFAQVDTFLRSKLPSPK